MSFGDEIFRQFWYNVLKVILSKFFISLRLLYIYLICCPVFFYLFSLMRHTSRWWAIPGLWSSWDVCLSVYVECLETLFITKSLKKWAGAPLFLDSSLALSLSLSLSHSFTLCHTHFQDLPFELNNDLYFIYTQLLTDPNWILGREYGWWWCALSWEIISLGHWPH